MQRTLVSGFLLGPIRAAASVLGSRKTSRESKCVLWFLDPVDTRTLQRDCGSEEKNADDPRWGLPRRGAL